MQLHGEQEPAQRRADRDTAVRTVGRVRRPRRAVAAGVIELELLRVAGRLADDRVPAREGLAEVDLRTGHRDLLSGRHAAVQEHRALGLRVDLGHRRRDDAVPVRVDEMRVDPARLGDSAGLQLARRDRDVLRTPVQVVVGEIEGVLEAVVGLQLLLDVERRRELVGIDQRELRTPPASRTSDLPRTDVDGRSDTVVTSPSSPYALSVACWLCAISARSSVAALGASRKW